MSSLLQSAQQVPQHLRQQFQIVPGRQVIGTCTASDPHQPSAGTFRSARAAPAPPPPIQMTVLLTLCLWALGCEPASRSRATPPANPPTAAASPSTGPADTRPAAAPTAAPITPQAAPAPKPTTPAATARKAEQGLSGRGSRYGGTITTAPLQARIRVEERLVLDHVEYALKLFQAEHGRWPSSQEEFMEKIVKQNNLSLPSLPAGDEYWYNPEKGQLMVRRGGP